MKSCSKCGEPKPEECFGSDKRASDGLQSACRDCRNGWHRDRHADQPETKRRQARSWYEANRDRAYAGNRARALADPERTRAYQRKHALKRFGITPGDYDTLLVHQGGHCALCPATSYYPKSRHLGVDHDHDTGAVRGLLCLACNGEIERVVAGTRQGAPDVLAYLAVTPFESWRQSLCVS